MSETFSPEPESAEGRTLSTEEMVTGLVDRLKEAIGDYRNEVFRRVWSLAQGWLSETSPDYKEKVRQELLVNVGAAITRVQMDQQMDAIAGREEAYDHYLALESLMSLQLILKD